MPKKPKPKPAKPKKTKSSPHNRNPKGNNQHWGGNGFRISFARRALAAGDRYSHVRAALVDRFSVHKGTAEKDIAEAQRRNEADADRDAPALMRESDLILRDAVEMGFEDRDGTAVVAARKEFHRIHGMHAAKKVHLSAEINVAIDVNAVVGILSDRGLEALDILMAEIEAAKARGELVPALLEAGADEDGEEAN